MALILPQSEEEGKGQQRKETVSLASDEGLLPLILYLTSQSPRDSHAMCKKKKSLGKVQCAAHGIHRPRYDLTQAHTAIYQYGNTSPIH